jgi:transposase-like protein
VNRIPPVINRLSARNRPTPAAGKSWDIIMTQLERFMARFPTEDACRRRLEQIRWPHGPTCLHCRNPNPTEIPSRAGLYYCKTCRKRFTVRDFCPLEGMQLPLRKFFALLFMFDNLDMTAPFQFTEQVMQLDISRETARGGIDRAAAMFRTVPGLAMAILGKSYNQDDVELPREIRATLVIPPPPRKRRPRRLHAMT